LIAGDKGRNGCGGSCKRGETKSQGLQIGSGETKNTNRPGRCCQAPNSACSIAFAASKAKDDEQNQQRQDELDELKQRFTDVQFARSNLADLAKSQSPFPGKNLAEGELRWSC
jgi:hypothetical protein